MLYYPLLAAVSLPWLLLFYGSFRKMYCFSGRLQRLQWEGSSLILLGMIGSWILFDRHVGLDPEGKGRFAYWYRHGEYGFFSIGQLLLFLGYFLERRPRPGMVPWSLFAKLTAALPILIGMAAALALTGKWTISGWSMPWDASRIVWSLGLIPCAVRYAVEARHHTSRSLKIETFNITGEEES